MAVIVRPINADGLRRLLAERFPDGEPEFETEAWHDWANLTAALTLVTRNG